MARPNAAGMDKRPLKGSLPMNPLWLFLIVPGTVVLSVVIGIRLLASVVYNSINRHK